MPTYEYECEKCGKRFEKFQKMTDAPVKHCPECGGKATRLIGSGGGIIFKGSGFYHTDYKKKDNKAEKTCDKASPDGCKGCSLNKEKK